MWTLVPGISSPRRLGGLVLALAWLVLAAAPAPAAEKEAASTPPPTATATATDNIFTGKFFCSLRRQVDLPFKGTITALKVQPGQRVDKGGILARYRLAPEAALEVRRRLLPPQIKELEMKLAEVERNLPALESKQRELTQLAQQQLAPPQSKAQIDREVQLLARQRQAVRERLNQEQQLAQEDLVLLKQQLGEALQPGQVPREAALRAPVAGYVIWIHQDLREGAELGPTAAVFQVGVMDPMLVRAQAYEIEALQLTPGELAEVTVESIPGRKFEARVSRVSWAPLATALDQPSYYEVELSVPNPDLVLKEGLKGRIVFRKSP